jgi:RNA polymerase sigma-70 factor (ECF subfamily)
MPGAKNPRPSVTDEALIQRCLEGDESAFEAIVHRYETELYRFLYRFLGTSSQAEDVFQETFLQVHVSLHTFDRSRRFKPWLFTIAANKARDSMRRSGQRPMLLAPSHAEHRGGRGEGPLPMDLLEAGLPGPDEEVATRDVQARVQSMVNELPAHLREVLLLAYFHGMAYSEIAQTLGIPLGTVKSRLHAAVATFAQQWKHRHGEADRD